MKRTRLPLLFALLAAGSLAFSQAFSQSQQPAVGPAVPAAPDYGKIADAFQVLADQFRTLAPQSPTPPQPTSPQLPILTADRLAVLRRMQSDNHPYWQVLKATADRTVAGNPIYDDLGQAAAIVYRTTGDKTYAAAAWTQLQAVMSKDGRAANDVRQRYLDYLLIFAWLRDSLTADQATTFEAAIKQWSDYCLGVDQPQYVGSFRLNDSDQTTGQFFGLVLQDSLGLPPGNLLSQNITNLNTGKAGAPVGGLTATVASTSTVRNTINWYVSSLAAGGEWPESSQYDANTVGCLLVPGFISAWDATGSNSFPEITAYIPAACRAALVDWTPALESRVLWGDNDNTTAAGPNLYKLMPYLSALQFAANRVGATNEASQVGGLIQALEAKYPEAISQAEIHFFYFCDPYSPTSAYRTPTASQSNYSPGVGLYRRIDGSKLFFGYSPSRIDIDHEFNLVGDLRLFAGGEWAIAEPISYGGTGFSDTSNSITVSGISSMRQQGYVGYAETADYTYLNALTAGPLYDADESWSPPPEWCHELRRQVLYLPAQGAATQSTIIICDRVNSEDPLVARPDLAGYTNADASRIKGSQHRHIWRWNCPAQPTLADGSFSYKTAGGQWVQFCYFSPTGAVQAASYDEHVAWADYGIPASELMYGVALSPVADRQWDCMLWCVRLNPSADTPTLAMPSPGVAAVSVDGCSVLFSIDQANPQLDPTTAAVAGAAVGKTYLAGCSGAVAVVVK